jgi:hypothetical protein
MGEFSDQLKTTLDKIEAKRAAAKASILRFITREIPDEAARLTGLIRAISAVIHKHADEAPRRYPQMGNDPAAIELVMAKDVAGMIISAAGGQWDFEGYRPGVTQQRPTIVDGMIAMRDIPFEAIKTIAENDACNFVDRKDPPTPVLIRKVYEWLIAVGYVADRKGMVCDVAILGPDGTAAENHRSAIQERSAAAGVISARATSASTAFQTMPGRLGRVLSWIANTGALGMLVFFIIIAGHDSNPNNQMGLLAVGAAIALVVWLCGRGFRYILAGT